MTIDPPIAEPIIVPTVGEAVVGPGVSVELVKDVL